MKKLFAFILILLLCFCMLTAMLHITSKVSYSGNDVATIVPTLAPTKESDEIEFSPSVCVTQHGSKYHKSSCDTVKGRDVIRYTKNTAIEMGYEPCGYCYKEDK